MTGSRRSRRAGKAEFATRKRPFSKEGDDADARRPSCSFDGAMSGCSPGHRWHTLSLNGGSSLVQASASAVPLATPVASGRPSSCCLEESTVSRCATESSLIMGCPRCHNLMVEETFVDQETSPSVSSFTGWRCLICGEILDPIILQNRTLHPEPRYGHARW